MHDHAHIEIDGAHEFGTELATQSSGAIDGRAQTMPHDRSDRHPSTTDPAGGDHVEGAVTNGFQACRR